MPNYKPISFPQDHQAHHHNIEWWYFNGHLRGADRRDYAFMDCLFKADVKKVKIPFLRPLPLKDVYFSHSLLSDVKEQRSYPLIQPITFVSRDSFNKPYLFINYANPWLETSYFNSEISQQSADKFFLKTEQFELTLQAQKPPLLEGGSGYIKVADKYTYYYSLTDLKVSGQINCHQRWIPVTGQAWMDHQWANTSYSKDKWTWFSIQLANHLELVCFKYGGEKNHSYLASLCWPDGSFSHTDQVTLQPLTADTWTSPQTKATYQLGWQIDLPEFKLALTAQPLIKKQEMIFGSINYWEGPLTVKAKFKGQTIPGRGFLELVGYPSRYGDLFVLGSKFTKELSQTWLKSKHKLAQNFKLRS
jgi:predicted secreted hydrolase